MITVEQNTNGTAASAQLFNTELKAALSAIDEAVEALAKSTIHYSAALQIKGQIDSDPVKAAAKNLVGFDFSQLPEAQREAFFLAAKELQEKAKLIPDVDPAVTANITTKLAELGNGVEALVEAAKQLTQSIAQ